MQGSRQEDRESGQVSLYVGFLAASGHPQVASGPYRTYVNNEVAYRLADAGTIEREFAVLEAIADNFPKTVLTLDRIPLEAGRNPSPLPTGVAA